MMQFESPQVRALLLAKFVALLDESEQVMDHAEHGRTLHDLASGLLITPPGCCTMCAAVS